MRCTFYRPEKTNIVEFENIVGKMEYDLKRLITEEVSDLDVYYYIRGLLHAAKPLEHRDDMYFLGLDDPASMPSDARVDYFYRPTYIAAAFIMKAILKYPELENVHEICWEFADEIVAEIKEIFPKVLMGCTGRSFCGHGYGIIEQTIETVKFFIEAGAIEFVNKHPDMCPEFKELLEKILSGYRKCLENGNTVNGWGTDFADEVKMVLELVDSL